MKTKKKSYSEKVTNFYGAELAKIGSNYTCLVVIVIGFVLRKDMKLLSACDFSRILIHWKRKGMIRDITDDSEIPFNDSDKEYFHK